MGRKIEAYKKNFEQKRERKAPEKEADIDKADSLLNRQERARFETFFASRVGPDRKIHLRHKAGGTEYDITLELSDTHVRVTQAHLEEGRQQTRSTSVTYARLMNGRIPTIAMAEKAIQSAKKADQQQYAEVRERYDSPEKIKAMLTDKMSTILAVLENMDQETFRKLYEKAPGKLYEDATLSLARLMAGIEQRIGRDWPADTPESTLSVHGFEVSIPSLRTHFDRSNKELQQWLRQTEEKHGIRRA